MYIVAYVATNNSKLAGIYPKSSVRFTTYRKSSPIPIYWRIVLRMYIPCANILGHRATRVHPMCQHIGASCYACTSHVPTYWHSRPKCVSVKFIYPQANTSAYPALASTRNEVDRRVWTFGGHSTNTGGGQRTGSRWVCESGECRERKKRRAKQLKRRG